MLAAHPRRVFCTEYPPPGAFILRLEQKNRTRVLYRTILCLNHGPFYLYIALSRELGHKHPITLPLFLPVRPALILTRGGGYLNSKVVGRGAYICAHTRAPKVDPKCMFILVVHHNYFRAFLYRCIYLK